MRPATKEVGIRLLIISAIDQKALDVLENTHDVVYELNPSQEQLGFLVHEKDVLIFRSGVTISRDILTKASDLKLVIRAGSGIDNIDLPEIQQKGIVFKRIPQPSAIAVSELCLGLMVVLARRIIEADYKTKKGQWPKYDLGGSVLNGKTLGIVGSGNIGTRTGKLGALLGMNVLGCVGSPCRKTKEHLAINRITLASFDEINRNADFLSLHVPLHGSTRHMINKHTLSRMKKDSFLLNFSRGGVVDETALYDALINKDRLQGAALDVHEKEGKGIISPLASLPNVILTPHIGSQTADTQFEIGQELIRILDSFDGA